MNSTINPLCTGGGAFLPALSYFTLGRSKYIFLGLSITCKLGPWSYGSFETFLGSIQPSFEKLWPFLHGQSDNFVCVKSSKIAKKSKFDSNFHSFSGINCLQTYYTPRAMSMGLHMRYWSSILNHFWGQYEFFPENHKSKDLPEWTNWAKKVNIFKSPTFGQFYTFCSDSFFVAFLTSNTYF